MTPIDVRPTQTSRWIALGAAATIVTVTVLVSTIAALITLIAWTTLFVSFLRQSRPGVTTSVLISWTGIAVAAGADLPLFLTGGCVVASVIVWDTANRAIRLGHQLTHTADTRDIEFLHAGTTMVVGVASFTVAYSVYRFAPGELPMASVLALVVGVFGLWYLLTHP